MRGERRKGEGGGGEGKGWRAGEREGGREARKGAEAQWRGGEERQGQLARGRQLAGVCGGSWMWRGHCHPPCTPLTALVSPSSVGLSCWTHPRLPTRPGLGREQRPAGHQNPGLCKALGLGESAAGVAQGSLSPALGHSPASTSLPMWGPLRRSKTAVLKAVASAGSGPWRAGQQGPRLPFPCLAGEPGWKANLEKGPKGRCWDTAGPTWGSQFSRGGRSCTMS